MQSSVPSLVVRLLQYKQGGAVLSSVARVRRQSEQRQLLSASPGIARAVFIWFATSEILLSFRASSVNTPTPQELPLLDWWRRWSVISTELCQGSECYGASHTTHIGILLRHNATKLPRHQLYLQNTHLVCPVAWLRRSTVVFTTLPPYNLAFAAAMPGPEPMREVVSRPTLEGDVFKDGAHSIA
ncbi:hypothetical protein NDU88_001259 [Pleurodeles waltl]|uniref:Uncharacterized protein n=1 Tax=Pleurodeles waltl TaxID=8319 RepID=A0AAV7SZ32_PLEWA|nr:hypothetical protein NDU88_001259 [Pleurodeles waltl]